MSYVSDLFSDLTYALVTSNTSYSNGSFFFRGDSLGDIIIQKDGKIVALGEFDSNLGGQIALARYNLNGSLDVSFDDDGWLVTSVPGYAYAWEQSAFIQDDGKILITAGIARDGGDMNIALLRYNQNGSLDTSFGNNGISAMNLGFMERAQKGVVQLADGSILVGGKFYERDIPGDPPEEYFALHFSANGKLDTSLGDNGIISFGTSNAEFGSVGINDIRVVNSGQVLVFSIVYSESLHANIYESARYNLDGSLDSSYGVNGHVALFPIERLQGAELGFHADGQFEYGLEFSDPLTLEVQHIILNVSKNGEILSHKELIINDDENSTFSKYLNNKDYEDFYVIKDNNIFVPLYSEISNNFTLEIFSIKDGVNGTNGDDNINGKSDDDLIIGLAGNDTLNGLIGNDILIGGSGFDSAIFSGKESEYTIVVNNDGSRTVTDSVSGRDGADTLFDIEQLIFSAADQSPPIAISFNPTDGATNVPTTANIIVNFSETIQRGAGNIVLKDATGATVETFNAASSSHLAIAGSTLTIDPTNVLFGNTHYYVDLAPGTVMDLAGNSYAGTSTYDFTTVGTIGSDTTPPTVVSFNPADGASGLSTTTNIILAFNETVHRGDGDIVLKTVTGTIVETYDAATSNRVSISGNTLAIDPANILANGTKYFVTFEAGTVEDLAGNPYVGTTTYDFTTVASAQMGFPGFDKAYYLNEKLAKLQADPFTAADWANKDTAYLDGLLNSFGMTAESHYIYYGYQEGLAPNAFFNPAEYKLAKATDMFMDGGYSSVAAAQALLESAWQGNIYQHYLQYGSKEGINPSNSFDESSYYDAKLALIQADPNSGWAGKTSLDLKAFFDSLNVTPLQHFFLYGDNEGIVATPVPPSERVGDSHDNMLMPMEVGWSFNYVRTDNSGAEWDNNFTITGTEIIDGDIYFEGIRFNYRNSGDYTSMYFFSTEDQIRISADGVNSFLLFDTNLNINDYYKTNVDTYAKYVGIDQIETPYTGTVQAMVIMQTKNLNFDNTPNFSNESLNWYEAIVPGVGIVQEYDNWTSKPPKINALVNIEKPPTVFISELSESVGSTQFANSLGMNQSEVNLVGVDVQQEPDFYTTV